MVEFNQKVLGFKLDTQVTIGIKSAPSELACAVFCVNTAGCRCYTFCGRASCQLNSNDIHSEGDSFIQDAECIYGGMRRTTIPECEQGGVARGIREDYKPNFCLISLKRTDPVWSPWTPRHLDSNYDWKTRECSIGSHVDQLNCTGDSRVIYTEFKFVRSSMTWFEARDYCSSNGFKLLDDLATYGSEDALLFFADRMNGGYWLGISDRNSQGTFKDLEGNIVNSLIKWRPGQAVNEADDYLAMMNQEPMTVFNDLRNDNKRGAICFIKR